MDLMRDFAWAIDRLRLDWRQRRPERVHDKLPPNYTQSTLRYVRRNACRDAAPSTIECAQWTQTDPYPPDPTIPRYPLDLDESEREGPFIKETQFSCGRCKHPIVTSEVLLQKLGLTEHRPNFSVRSWERYINEGKPMPLDDFRRVVANSLAQGWLGLWQAVSAWMQIEQLLATQRGLRAVLQRAREREAFIERGELDVSEAEVERELAKQLRLLANEETRTLDQMLKRPDLPPELRRIIEEVLHDARKRP